MKIRSLAVLPLLAIACLSLTGCDSKAGTAAVVNGTKISESDLASYLTPDAKPIASSDGTSSISPRTFVLQYLISNEIFGLLLAGVGSPVTEAQLAAEHGAALAGGTEADLLKQIADVGLQPKFESVVLRNRELLSVIRNNKKLSSDALVTPELAKVKDAVSVNPRFGSWDPTAIAMVELGKKQLPSMLTLDTTLPGDVKAPTGQ